MKSKKLKKSSRYKPYDTEVVCKNVLKHYFGGECNYCKSRERLHFHHKTPRCVGGKDEMSNIELVCMNCHVNLHKQMRKINPFKSKNRSAIDELMDMQNAWLKCD